MNMQSRLISEINVGHTNRAICIAAIGDQFAKLFNSTYLPLISSYCRKYDLGLLILNNFIDDKSTLSPPFDKKIWLQCLKLPGLVMELFPNYTEICLIDADCIPSPIARNIFKFADALNFDDNDIFLTKRTPPNFPRESIGRRLSLLRKLYLDESFPLDSLLSASDDDEKRLFKLDFKGEIATIGTCIGKTLKLDQCFKIVLSKITKNFSGYSQQYVNEVFQKESNIKWLPYEFQAIWNYELGLYYPSLFSNYSIERSREALIQTLTRVDMLHFAGSWVENNIYKDRLHKEISNNLDRYLELLPDLLEENLSIKSYGTIKPPPQ